MFFFVFSEIGFKPFGKFAAVEHDAPSAALTFQSNIRAEARDGPFVGAAGMLFAQAQVVVEAQVWEHVSLGLRRLSDELLNLYVYFRHPKFWCKYYKLNCDKLRTRILPRRIENV